MDIINAQSIIRAADVQKLTKLVSHTGKEGLFWRSAFSYVTSELSVSRGTLRFYCIEARSRFISRLTRMRRLILAVSL